MEKVRNIGKQICSELPQEAVVGNMVRRILRIIREECDATGKVTVFICPIYIIKI